MVTTIKLAEELQIALARYFAQCSTRFSFGYLPSESLPLAETIFTQVSNPWQRLGLAHGFDPSTGFPNGETAIAFYFLPLDGFVGLGDKTEIPGVSPGFTATETSTEFGLTAQIVTSDTSCPKLGIMIPTNTGSTELERIVRGVTINDG